MMSGIPVVNNRVVDASVRGGRKTDVSREANFRGLVGRVEQEEGGEQDQ